MEQNKYFKNDVKSGHKRREVNFYFLKKEEKKWIWGRSQEFNRQVQFSLIVLMSPGKKTNKVKQSSVYMPFVQLVRATRASTTFPMCSLRLRSATAREISISDICTATRTKE